MDVGEKSFDIAERERERGFLCCRKRGENEEGEFERECLGGNVDEENGRGLAVQYLHT